MLTRRKILFNVIKELGSATPFEIQKAIFLCYIEFGNPFPYSFFPNIRGNYSINLHDDYHILEKQGYLSFDRSSNSYSSAITKSDEFSLPEESLAKIKTATKKFKSFSGTGDLIKYVYKIKPYYAYRSKVLDLMDGETEFFESFNNIKNKIQSEPHLIYTIGYQDHNIDLLVSKLIYKNIKTLIDVRKNAFSMRIEFSKPTLMRACQEAGITYIHLPDAGIDTFKRNELLPEGKQTELFDWYKAEVLEKKPYLVDKIYSYFKNGSVCLLCYEKNPMDCHRLRLAEYCLEEKFQFNGIYNL